MAFIKYGPLNVKDLQPSKEHGYEAVFARGIKPHESQLRGLMSIYAICGGIMMTFSRSEKVTHRPDAL